MWELRWLRRACKPYFRPTSDEVLAFYNDLSSQATRASRTGLRTVQSMSKRQFWVICNSGCIFAHGLVVAAVCIAGCGG